MKTTTSKLLAAALGVAGFAVTASADTTLKPTTALELQTDLTTLASTSGNNTILLESSANLGYYSGNFNYNSTVNNSLTIQPDAGAGTITIDAIGTGRGLDITNSGDVTVNGITFVRNCGSDTIGALRIATANTGNIKVTQCYFLSPPTGAGMGLEIASGFNATIQNCYFIGKTNSTTGGAANYDGHGLSISGVTSATLIQGCTMSGNYQGWGAYITASGVLGVAGNVFQTNYSGGLYFDPSGVTKKAQVYVTNNVFYGNKTSGGAQLINFNTLNISNNFFSGNPGGGVDVETGTSVTNTGNTFLGNGNAGGGLYFYNLTTAVSTGNTFSGNNYSGGSGAYFYLITTNIVAGNTFSGNISSGGAGGAFFQSCQYLTLSNNTFGANQANNGSGGGVYINGSGVAFATVVGNTFTGNSCSGNFGGGALSINGVTNLITQNTFQRNSSADGGGAIYDTAPVITMTDNLVVTNSQSGASASGGGVYVNASSTLYMINNTIFNNASGGNGGGASFQVTGLTPLLYVFNNIIYGNSAAGSGQDVFLSGSDSGTIFEYNDVANPNDIGVWYFTKPAPLLHSDPQFFDPINGDYHFQGSATPNPPGPSPCANAGTVASDPYLTATALAALPATDLDGNPRINSGQIDLGCYQFNNTATHPADTSVAGTITLNEFNAYSFAWIHGLAWNLVIPPQLSTTPNPTNPIPANYVTRAGYLLMIGGGINGIPAQNGGYYNDGSDRPTNWKPLPPQVTVALAPASGPALTPVNVTASGFQAGESIAIYYNGLGGIEVDSPMNPINADPTGNVSANFIVPAAYYLSGIYTVVLKGGSSGRVGSAQFNQTSQVTMGLNPATGSVGASVNVTASGFLASESVALYYNGLAMTNPQNIITADSSGNINYNFTVPSNFPDNTYTVGLTGLTSGRICGAQFTQVTFH